MIHHYIYPAVFFHKEEEFQAIIPDLNISTAGISLEEVYLLIKDYLKVYCMYAEKFDLEIENPSEFEFIYKKYKQNDNHIMLIDAIFTDEALKEKIKKK